MLQNSHVKRQYVLDSKVVLISLNMAQKSTEFWAKENYKALNEVYDVPPFQMKHILHSEEVLIVFA